MKKIALLAPRALFAGFQLLTALYCLMAYLPFTYHQVHVGGLLPWLDEFARLHCWLNLAMLALAFPLLIAPWQRGALARWLAAGFAVYQAALAYLLVAHPVLPNLGNDSLSLGWGLASLLPVAWLAAIDLAAYAGRVQWSERAAGRPAYFAAWRGALFVAALYGGVFFLRRPAGAFQPSEAMALGWSLLLHLLLFLGGFLLLECLAGLAGLFRQPAQVEFALCHLLLAAAVSAVLHNVVWAPLGLTGWAEAAFTAALAAALALANAGAAAFLAAEQPAGDGIAAAAAPITLGLARSWSSGLGLLLGLGLLGGLAAVQAAAFDWNYLVQKLTAAGIWLASFACFYSIGTRRVRASSLGWLAVPLLLLGAYKGIGAAAPAPAPALQSWAGYDASFRLAQQFLTPPRHDEESFFQFLNRNTNIAASVRVDPVSVELAAGLSQAPGPLPNIFIFTIDSLRRDYLSPYNPAVGFTPAIAAFARESTVFENAFTRYGGTGLSEPAIWSGSLLLHKQYVTPFAPMNALEKLIHADQYQAYVSRDPILHSILQPADGDVDLEGATSALAVEFSRSLEVLEQQLDRRPAGGKPVFAYVQPQNLHISTIQRQGATAPADEHYPGFYAPYAWRLKGVDRAFGEFIEFLKARGLYDNSIVVLTADHGDSLGEEGRWGHAYTLFPEIVRIPLLIHLPADLRGKVSSDPAAVAFSTDITPSLYYLLGHRPVQKNPLFGSPLFTETAAERARDPQASYLLASSYGAVYGILKGRQLYVADGVNYGNYRFELNALSAESRPVSAGFQREQDELIRNGIQAVDRFYRFDAQSGGQP